MTDKNKICFITCVNQEDFYAESLLYLRHLKVPDHMQVEYIAVRGAVSMAAGYNEGMRRARGRYKLYLHQDVLLLKPNVIKDLLAVFDRHPDAGIAGIAGSVCEQSCSQLRW